MIKRVLKLDVGGRPIAWITREEGALLCLPTPGYSAAVDIHQQRVVGFLGKPAFVAEASPGAHRLHFFRVGKIFLQAMG